MTEREEWTDRDGTGCVAAAAAPGSLCETCAGDTPATLEVRFYPPDSDGSFGTLVCAECLAALRAGEE